MSEKTATLPENNQLAPEPAIEDSAAEDREAEEDFNPLGQIEGWSAYECASGPFGHRG
jgi:hypothetical protein